MAVTTDNVILAGFVGTKTPSSNSSANHSRRSLYGIGLKKYDHEFLVHFINSILEEAEKDWGVEKALGKHWPVRIIPPINPPSV